MDEMNQFTQEQLDYLYSLLNNDPEGCLRLLKEYQLKYHHDPNFWINSSGLLIDLGDHFNRPGLVEEGIKIIEQVLDKRDFKEPSLFYNVANGYMSLYGIKKRLDGPNFCVNTDETPLINAKKLYRKALEKRGTLNLKLRAQLLVNYGNCLSALGRSVEAMEAYDNALLIIPSHLMAKGNLAIEFHYFARITRHSIFLLDAHEILEEVTSYDDLGDYAGPHAKQFFENQKEIIANEIVQMGLKETKVRKGTNRPDNKRTKEYIDFCARNQLFLNLCHSCRRCEHYNQDNVTFSLQTDLDDNVSFIRLSRVINNIKEQYSFARFLFYKALYPGENLIPIDRLTSYIDNLDYAVYGSRVASMKLSFECAFNVLDKIAHFLNDYLDLGLTDGREITFTTNGKIWKENGNLRSEIQTRNNYSLFGLYDIARELDIDFKEPNNDGYLGHLRRTRNYLTHEYLILHVEKISWATEADSDTVHLIYSDFVDQVMEVLKLVRSAIIYLIAFIDLEERRKAGKTKGFIAPMYSTEFDHKLFSSSFEINKY